MLFKLGLEPVQLVFLTGFGEITTMHRTPEATLFLVEYTCARVADPEPEIVNQR